MKNYNICSQCVLEPYISQEIESEGKEATCCICDKTKKVKNILSLDLSPFFDNIFYTDTNDSVEITDDNKKDFCSLLEEFYFLKLGIDKEYIIKYYIDKNYPNLYSSFLIQSSEIIKKLNKNIWNDLLEEVKHERRFIFKESTSKLLFEIQKYSFIFLEKVDKETILYRGRVGNYYSEEDFLKPPKDKAQHLRANPYGIPYLYLTNDKDCCINECRLNYPNSISIAEFYLINDIYLLNLTKKPSIIEMCRISDGMEPENIFNIIEVFSHIDEEMSKPVYDDKKHLDYILTQLFTECVKLAHESIKEKEGQHIDGIIFRSSFDFKNNKNWKNYVLFNDKDILNLKNTEYYSWIYEDKIHKLELFNKLY